MVQFETSHFEKDGLTHEDYIKLSGGMKAQADEDRVYIVKADGSVKLPSKSSWFSSASAEALSAGDTIVVPMELGYMDDLTLWTSVTQILYQTGVAVAAIASL